jgi:hypothetical protein
LGYKAVTGNHGLEKCMKQIEESFHLSVEKMCFTRKIKAAQIKQI